MSVAKLKGGVTKIKGGVAKASAKGEVPAKRARTAFIFFCSEKRPEVTARGLSFGEITKELAIMWKVLFSIFFLVLAQRTLLAQWMIPLHSIHVQALTRMIPLHSINVQAHTPD